jgi:hypothetical protein
MVYPIVDGFKKRGSGDGEILQKAACAGRFNAV